MLVVPLACGFGSRGMHDIRRHFLADSCALSRHDSKRGFYAIERWGGVSEVGPNDHRELSACSTATTISIGLLLVVPRMS